MRVGFGLVCFRFVLGYLNDNVRLMLDVPKSHDAVYC